DPDLLVFAETERRVIVSHDRTTLPVHRAAHWAAGRHTWGVCFLRPRFSAPQYADALFLAWSASDLDEWRDALSTFPGKESTRRSWPPLNLYSCAALASPTARRSRATAPTAATGP